MINREGDIWTQIALPARRFTPFRSLIDFGDCLMVGRLDGEILLLATADARLAVRNDRVRLAGPLVLLEQIDESDWIAVGQKEVVFGRIAQDRDKLLEVERKRLDNDFGVSTHSGLRRAAYAKGSDILVLCFEDGRITAIDAGRKSRITSKEPASLALEFIAGIAGSKESILMITSSGKVLSYTLNGDAANAVLNVIPETSIHISSAFLVSGSSWVAEVRRGQTTEFVAVQEGTVKHLVTLDGFRLLGANGEDATFAVCSDSVARQVIEIRRYSDGSLLQAINWGELQ